MDLKDKLFEIDVEINKGLKLRAADRLKNLLGHYPDEPQIRFKLAELYYESGFYDAAGKYWILTEPDEERIKNVLKCMRNL
nr:tetratricopeptide repeat protein [Flavobacterium rivuli]